MTIKSQLQFISRCSVLMESGISLSETLSIILKMEKNGKNRATLSAITEQVERGVLFSKSISQFKKHFDPTLCAMIVYGESSGILAVSMRQAATILEKRDGLKKKIISALIYPMFIAGATVCMTLFLVMYIFPKILPLLSSMNIELPLLTRMVKKLYEILAGYGVWIFVTGILLVGISYFLYKKKERLRYRVHLGLLLLPIIGEMIKKYYICLHCRAAGTLLQAGQSLPTIVIANAHAYDFIPYKKAWEFAQEEIMRGVSLSTYIRTLTSLFPSVVPDMLSIGERTGSLASMFNHISRMYDEELDGFIKQIASTIEPVLMIGMGLIVGSVALSIILPIYEITNHLNS